MKLRSPKQNQVPQLQIGGSHLYNQYVRCYVKENPPPKIAFFFRLRKPVHFPPCIPKGYWWANFGHLLPPNFDEMLAAMFHGRSRVQKVRKWKWSLDLKMVHQTEIVVVWSRCWFHKFLKMGWNHQLSWCFGWSFSLCLITAKGSSERHRTRETFPDGSTWIYHDGPCLVPTKIKIFLHREQCYTSQNNTDGFPKKTICNHPQR